MGYGVTKSPSYEFKVFCSSSCLGHRCAQQDLSPIQSVVLSALFLQTYVYPIRSFICTGRRYNDLDPTGGFAFSRGCRWRKMLHSHHVSWPYQKRLLNDHQISSSVLGSTLGSSISAWRNNGIYTVVCISKLWISYNRIMCVQKHVLSSNLFIFVFAK